MREHDDALTIASPGGRLHATFHPALNMLCSSLVHDGDELLHLRAGIEAYAERGKTCGIPFLHPWANRLSQDRYELYGRIGELKDRSRPIPRDANGLPNHGLLGGRTQWTVTDSSRSSVTAQFDFSDPDLLASFPFPHEVRMAAALGDDGLSIVTSVIAAGADPVPVSFGYHPYLRIPGVAREDWAIALPVQRHLLLDSRSIPTGQSEPAGFVQGPLGARVFDDAFTGIVEPRRFSIEGGGRRIDVVFDEGFPYAQVFAPAGSDFFCIEPMTAPANALLHGGAGLPTASGAKPFQAGFRILVGVDAE